MNNKFKKRLLSFLCCFCLLCFEAQITYADGTFEIGDYFLIGKYNDIPILWRYAANDDNGKLIVSDKVICFKRFSSPNIEKDYGSSMAWSGIEWKTSNIRAWLNSAGAAGEVTWLANNPPNAYKYNKGYADESGFLSDNNFNQAERNLFKPVTQWTMLRSAGIYGEKSENGLTYTYNIIKISASDYGDGHDSPKNPTVYYNITDIPNIYYGAAVQSVDTVFLLDEQQLYSMYKNFGTVNTTSVDAEYENKYVSYILRGGFSAWLIDDYGRSSASENLGIRPAFYLNETALSGMTGSGTAEDPYILIPDPDYVSVEVNGEDIAFDVAPVMENDRVLVPMRAIFESLGAEVTWEESTQTVTATKDTDVITMQIDNNIMTKNGEEVVVDTPARLVSDRTLVPLRVISESFGITVDWNEAERRVTLAKE